MRARTHTLGRTWMAVPAGLALCVSGSNLHCAGIVGITDVPGGDGGALPGFDSGFDGSRPHLDGSPPGTDGGHPGTDGSQPGTDSSQPRSDGGGSPLTFAPSNVGGMSFSAAGLGPLTLNGGDNCAVFTDYPSQPIISCSAPLNPSMEVFGVNMPGGAGEAIIYVFTDVSIGAGSILDIQGPLPVIIVALGSVDIAGAIDASADQFGSVGAVGIPGARLTGPGIGGFNAQMGPQGGGGGSFCGLGGQGAIGTTGTVQSESMPGASYGTANLIPLWGGSAGGGASTQTGSVTANGYGGGAIQISAAGQITVESGGYISVNGSGGVASNEAGEGAAAEAGFCSRLRR